MANQKDKTTHKPWYTYLTYKLTNIFMRGIVWDAHRFNLVPLLSFIFIGGILNIPSITTWQYWVFLISILIAAFSLYIKGNLKGVEIEQQDHAKHYICIPKEILIQQAKLQETLEKLQKLTDKDENLTN